jgi:transcriptional regulator with XRE-family HTH domain
MLKRWMKKNKMTMSQVAKLVGCSVTTISNIANGKFPDSVDVLLKIVKLTKGEISLEKLVEEKNKKSKQKKEN